MRTCHYVVLGIEKNASESDIKKAYRRKALEWHPDKNHHRVEEATKQFAFIAEAYEVLSDPQERAWYDSHRDAILRGDDKSDQTESAAGTTSAELMKYFSSSIYKGFQDNNAGFFAVYRNIFDKLAQEEAEAVANDRSEDSTGAQVKFPSFGCSTTSYDDNSDSDVKQFYNAWLTFSSQKSFSWCDKYRLSEAPDRRVRRAMEKENKKFRDAARKEFNDTVLSLASYVRKRDPRFLAYQEQQKQKQKQIQTDLKAKLEKEKELLRAKAEQFQEQEWSRVQDEDEDESGSDKSEDEFDQEYECIICDKSFKSERQWKNHERSKRHLKALEDIRLEMLHEESQLMGQSPADGVSNNGEDVEVDEVDEEEEELEIPITSATKVTEKQVEDDALSGSDMDEPVEIATPIYSDLLKSKKKNKKKKVMTTGHDLDEGELDEMDQDGLADLLGSVRLSSTSSPMNRSRASTPSSRRSRAGQKDHWEGESDEETPVSTAPASRAESPDNGKGKKLSAKEKKKARSEKAAQKLADAGLATKCRVCAVDFDTKNQLFNHIKETGHATATTSSPLAASAKGSSGTSGPAAEKDGFYSSEDERGRGKGKKGRGKRK